MTKWLVMALPITSMIAWSAGCGGPGSESAADAGDVESAVAAINQFALELYGTLRSGAAGNLVVSPYSVSTVMAIVYAGARGETESAIADTLHFALPQERLHRTMGDVAEGLRSSQPGCQFSTDNSLWIRQGSSLLPDFLAIAQEQYGATVQSVDFAGNPQEALRRIDEWSVKHTRGTTGEPAITPPFTDETAIVLVNAVYFRGTWRHVFPQQLTREALFAVGPDKKVPVPMMRQAEAELGYAALPDLELLEMPYQGGDHAMLVLLPSRIDGLPQLEASLSVENLSQWKARLEKQEVWVSMPRFSTSFRSDLVPALASMGMSAACGATTADFSGVRAERPLFVSQVIHQAQIRVTEEGTEASAASRVEMCEPKPIKPPPRFIADHPFLYLIEHKPTGCILFIGRCVDPQAERDQKIE